MLWDALNNPTGLHASIHAGWLQTLLEPAEYRHFPKAGPGDRLERAGQVFDAIARLGITYTHEPAGSSPDCQEIRSAEDVVSQRVGTCVDLCALFCSAALDAGLHPLVVIFSTEKSRHAFVLVYLDRDWDMTSSKIIDAGFSRNGLPHDYVDPRASSAQDPSDGTATWAAIDVIALTANEERCGDAWQNALRQGRSHLTKPWELCVDIGGLCTSKDKLPPPSPSRAAYTALRPALHRNEMQHFDLKSFIDPHNTYLPFIRSNEFDNLLTWIVATSDESRNRFKPHTSPATNISIALISGGNLTGKTRTAIEICKELDAHGWLTGFLRSKVLLSDAQLEALTNLNRNVCIAIDDNIPKLSQRFATLSNYLQNRLRKTVIILIGTNIVQQWHELSTDLRADGMTFTDVHNCMLPPYPASNEEVFSVTQSTLSEHGFGKAFSVPFDIDSRREPIGKLITQAWNQLTGDRIMDQLDDSASSTSDFPLFESSRDAIPAFWLGTHGVVSPQHLYDEGNAYMLSTEQIASDFSDQPPKPTSTHSTQAQ